MLHSAAPPSQFNMFPFAGAVGGHTSLQQPLAGQQPLNSNNNGGGSDMTSIHAAANVANVFAGNAMLGGGGGSHPAAVAAGLQAAQQHMHHQAASAAHHHQQQQQGWGLSKLSPLAHSEHQKKSASLCNLHRNINFKCKKCKKNLLIRKEIYSNWCLKNSSLF